MEAAEYLNTDQVEYGQGGAYQNVYPEHPRYVFFSFLLSSFTPSSLPLCKFSLEFTPLHSHPSISYINPTTLPPPPPPTSTRTNHLNQPTNQLIPPFNNPQLPNRLRQSSLHEPLRQRRLTRSTRQSELSPTDDAACSPFFRIDSGLASRGGKDCCCWCW